MTEEEEWGLVNIIVYLAIMIGIVYWGLYN